MVIVLLYWKIQLLLVYLCHQARIKATIGVCKDVDPFFGSGKDNVIYSMTVACNLSKPLAPLVPKGVAETLRLQLS
jgi:hypothetical protein